MGGYVKPVSYTCHDFSLAWLFSLALVTGNPGVCCGGTYRVYILVLVTGYPGVCCGGTYRMYILVLVTGNPGVCCGNIYNRLYILWAECILYEFSPTTHRSCCQTMMFYVHLSLIEITAKLMCSLLCPRQFSSTSWQDNWDMKDLTQEWNKYK